MWTDPKHLSHWVPPTGFEMKYIRADIREGGSTFYVMSGARDTKMYGRAEYLEIENPDRIIYTQQFCDEQEKILRHPMASTWPETMLTTINFVEESADQTRVALTWETYGNTTSEELETFVKAKQGITQGWSGSFDKLEAYVSQD